MNGHDRGELIRIAIAPDSRLKAPPDLGDAIFRAVVATPQRRPALRWGRLALAPSNALVLLLLTGLLVVALGVAAILGRPPVGLPRIEAYHGGPDRAGVMPGPGPAGQVRIDWEVDRPGGIPHTVMPLVADGRVFVGDDTGIVAALDEITGATRWEVSLGGRIDATPVISADLLVVATSDGTVAALSVTDGQRIWSRSVAPVSASLLVADGMIVVADGNGTVTAFEAQTGTTIWTRSFDESMSRGPALAGGTLYVGSDDGALRALDATTRETRWVVPLSGVLGTPVATADQVFLGQGLEDTGDVHDLVAIDVRTSEIAWTFASPSGKQVLMGGLASDTVFAVSEDGSISALDAAIGAVRWTYATDGPIGTLVGIVGDTIYVSSSDRIVRSLAAQTGVERWRIAVTGTPTTPAVIDGRVIVGTSLGKVVAIGGTNMP